MIAARVLSISANLAHPFQALARAEPLFFLIANQLSCPVKCVMPPYQDHPSRKWFSLVNRSVRHLLVFVHLWLRWTCQETGENVAFWWAAQQIQNSQNREVVPKERNSLKCPYFRKFGLFRTKQVGTAEWSMDIHLVLWLDNLLGSIATHLYVHRLCIIFTCQQEFRLFWRRL